MFFKKNDFQRGYEKAEELLGSHKRMGSTIVEATSSMQETVKGYKATPEWHAGFQSCVVKAIQAYISIPEVPKHQETLSEFLREKPLEERKGYLVAQSYYQEYVNLGYSYEEAHGKISLNAHNIHRHENLSVQDRFDFKMFLVKNAELLEKLENGVSFLENCLKLEVS
jgi:hypothetical protein